MKTRLHRLRDTLGEYVTHWSVTGAILAATGAAPEHWLADLFHEIHFPNDALPLWVQHLDYRLIAVVAGLTIIVGDTVWRNHRRRPPPDVVVPQFANDALAGPPLPDKPSIAVLPFENLSGDTDQEYFSDGVADDIIIELSRDHALFVISRNSSFTFRGRSVDVKKVNQELGVRYVVEGAVRRDSGRLRISAQLVEALTGEHVWAERYDRALQDIFSLQDEIARAVVASIRPALGEAEQRRVIRKPPNSLTAWESYQRGLWHLSKATQPENQQAIPHFHGAINIDPVFASPHVGLALCYMRDALFFASRSASEAGELISAEAREAITIDPGDSEAYVALSLAAAFAGDLQTALEHAERAVELNQNSAPAHWVRGGMLIYLGETERGRADTMISLRLNPRDIISAWAANMITTSYHIDRDYVHTLESARRTLANYPTFPGSYRYIAAALAQLGQLDEARIELRKWMTAAPAYFRVRTHERLPFVPIREHEHILEGLRKAGLTD